MTTTTLLLALSLLCICNNRHLGALAFLPPAPAGATSSNTRLHSTTAEETTDKDAATSSISSFAAPRKEIDRRRNLAIISHPDSGKTTMTEKLLLYGGALQQAGAVRMKGEQRATQSDFMEMEKQRGISISSTVMSFEYDNLCVNILDTPGHQDFSEDTYRALAAAHDDRGTHRDI